MLVLVIGCSYLCYTPNTLDWEVTLSQAPLMNALVILFFILLKKHEIDEEAGSHHHSLYLYIQVHWK